MIEPPSSILKTALLFINGQPPALLPAPGNYDVVACTDGAIDYLTKGHFPLDSLDFISGDLDSLPADLPAGLSEKLLCTPDQDRTDFEKALAILHQKKVDMVHVLGGSGGEMDHFLGNLTAAYRYFSKMHIRFYDAYAEYFFIPDDFSMRHVAGKMISLYPFPFAKNIHTSGLNWELHGEDLDQINRIGTRNFAVRDNVTIRYGGGALLLFVGQQYHKI